MALACLTRSSAYMTDHKQGESGSVRPCSTVRVVLGMYGNL